MFLAELAYELVPALLSQQALIGDPKDQPILGAAIVAGVDIVISGDKHFLALNLDRPRVMTAAQYMETVADQAAEGITVIPAKQAKQIEE